MSGMSKVNPYNRRTYKAPLEASRNRAVKVDLEVDLAEYLDGYWDFDYCSGCDYCDPTL